MYAWHPIACIACLIDIWSTCSTTNSSSGMAALQEYYLCSMCHSNESVKGTVWFSFSLWDSIVSLLSYITMPVWSIEKYVFFVTVLPTVEDIFRRFSDASTLLNSIEQEVALYLHIYARNCIAYNLHQHEAAVIWNAEMPLLAWL